MMEKPEECSDCKMYKTTLDACRNALKDVVKNQKKKIQEFREMNSKLQDDIYSLEDDIRVKEAFVQKVFKKGMIFKKK
jgi:argininosuccinate lyase